jgi:type I restriction enzyme, S subunit
MTDELGSMRLGIAIEELPKSRMRAGTATPAGRYPFYCSSPVVGRTDAALFEGEAVMMGTGGDATVHYGNGPLSYSTDTWAFRSSSGRLLTKYLWRWIQKNLAWIDYRCFQGTGLRHLQKGDLRATQLNLPSIPDQERAVAALDVVDGAIRNADALIEKLTRMKFGVTAELLTRGVDENGELRQFSREEDFCESPVGRIPRAWSVLPLERVAAVDRGKFSHRPRNDPAFYGGDFPFIQTGDVTLAAGERIVDATQSLNERGALVSKEFPSETIAVTIAANIGETAILGRPMFFPDSVVGVVVREPNSVRWIEMCLHRAKPRLDALAPQSAQKNINLEYLRPLLVPVPDPDEQLRAALIYEGLSGQLATELELRQKLNRVRAGLLADLVGGHEAQQMPITAA